MSPPFKKEAPAPTNKRIMASFYEILSAEDFSGYLLPFRKSFKNYLYLLFMAVLGSAVALV